MNSKLVVRPLAEQDLAEARDWYEQRQSGLGNRFLDAVEAAFARIQSWPESAPAEYRNVRRIKTQRFPYVVCYRITPNEIEVIAVLHGSRRSRLWRGRA